MVYFFPRDLKFTSPIKKMKRIDNMMIDLGFRRENDTMTTHHVYFKEHADDDPGHHRIAEVDIWQKNKCVAFTEYGDCGNIEVDITLDKAKTIPADELTEILCRVSIGFRTWTEVQNQRRELAQKADLEDKYRALKAKYRKLKEHLKYMPGGPGALAAQAHFEAAQKPI